MSKLDGRLANMSPLQRAMFALKETQDRLASLQRRLSEPIAIVGMACRFPGGANDPESYWRLLCDGMDAIRETPPDRWDANLFYDPNPAAPGKMNTRYGGFLERIDEFDNHFFGISDREAARIDPQQRILLELAWEALEDAGLPPISLRGENVGAFIGISLSDYGMLLADDLSQTDAHAATGTSLCLAANRLSFVFGWQGPSLALDTACSSSLVAVHLACQHIRHGDCEAAVAGGTSLLLSPVSTVNLTKAGFCAPDGRVRAFDALASGYVRGEGAGLVVLKRLSAALHNGDPIYAVIRGSAVNQNGGSNGLTAPSGAAQESVLREAYHRAGVSPGQVQYIETQGTGTRLGDAIEALALGSVLQRDRASGSRCRIGSVKTNIGHLEASAGVASLMKVALSLKHDQLPPSLHFQTPNPDIPFAQLPLQVQRQLESWPRSTQARLAGVSAFGFGGSNAHMVLEESPAAAATATATAPPLDRESQPGLLLLSARTERALRALAEGYVEFLNHVPPPWSDVCYTAAQRREHHDCRLAVLANSPEQALDALGGFLRGESPPEVWTGRKPYGRDLKLAFVYGDGNNGPPRWLPLVARIPGFSSAVEEVDAALQRVLGCSWASLLQLDSGCLHPAQTRSCLLALQLALTDWWLAVGVVPQVVLGRGSGELAAACAAGILSRDAALRVLAVHQTARGAASLDDFTAQPALLPFISALDGRTHKGVDLAAGHWRSCLEQSDGWADAIGSLRQRQVDVCLEIGTENLTGTLAGLLARSDSPVLELASLSPAADTASAALPTVAALYAKGADLAWKRLLSVSGRCVRLPGYPWQRQRLWTASKKWLTLGAAIQAGESAGGELPAAVSAASPAGGEGRLPPNPAIPSSEMRQPVQADPLQRRPRPDLTAPYVAPRTELEQILAAAWSELLGIDGIGIHDSFFELGGHSLLAGQAVSRIGQQFHVALPLREIFQTPSIAGLAASIETAQRDGAAAAFPAIVPIPRDSELPLSLNQEALWFLDRLERDRPTYMLYLALNVTGPLDVPALERALREIGRRHEVLRTTFPEREGAPIQAIAPDLPGSLSVADLSHLPEAERETELRRRIASEMRRPIDLQHGPLVRFTLFRRGENDHAVVACTHHIIHDGWSMSVLLSELAILYPAFAAGRNVQLPELSIQYVDFAAWQRQLLQGERLERLRNYWREQLAGVPSLELPTDWPRPAIRTTRGSTRPCQLSPETSHAVREYCRHEGVTPFMVLLAAFQVLLSRHSGQADFAIGVPVANRNRPETEPLIGYFVNVVVLRADLDDDPSFRETVSRVRQIALDAFERQEMTLDQVVDAVKPVRDLSRNPLFQAMFALQNIHLPQPPEIGLKITPLDDSPAPPSANFDLTLELFDRADGFQGGLNFSTDLFRPDTIDRMVQQYQVLVAAAIGAPDQNISALPLLDQDQQRSVVVCWNDTARDYDRSRLVQHLFETHAAQQPEAVAVVLEEQSWTYGELNAGANQLARFLQRQGVGPEVRVGICLERSPELIRAVLAVLKAGGAYVPLDPAHIRSAEERIQYILQDAQVSLVLTDLALGNQLDTGSARRLLLDGPDADEIGREGRENVVGAATADNLAYVLYTSGSTGRPKGVMVTQGNLLNAYQGWESVYHLESEVRSHLQMASFGFDVFTGDLVRALCSGGKLVICRKEILLDAAELLERIRREQVDCAEFVPLVLRNLVEYLVERRQTLNRMRLVIAGSDAWYAADHRSAQQVFGPGTRLINSYGLTETTIDSTYFEGDVEALSDRCQVPIGRPFPNVRVYVLDSLRQPTPPGVAGELYIGGDGVSRGYVNPAQAAERFVPDPFAERSHARLYRTGDRARWRADGQVEFLGRTDDQVKIRGYRVEPGEIEQVLREHPLVAQAAVVARERTSGDLRLVAYAVGADEATPDRAALQEFLAGRLPEYMIPSAFVILDAMPTTVSGKVDRKRLPAPDWSRFMVLREFVPPATAAEQQLAAIWREILNVAQIGVHDDFFQLGGNSLLALRLVSRVRGEFSIDLPLVTLFAAPRLGDLASRIAALQGMGLAAEMPAIRPRQQRDPVPMAYGQRRFWVSYRRFSSTQLFHQHMSLLIRGPIDAGLLQAAVNEMVRRHETMRTAFVEIPDDWPLQVVTPALPVDLPVEDLSHLPAERRDEEIAQRAQSHFAQRFDLSQAPLFRVRLLRFGPREHVLLVTAHHIISDGWSIQLLPMEIAMAYDAIASGRLSMLPELPIQYADYSQWQREYLQGDVLAKLLGFWRSNLSGLTPVVLPTDRPWQEELPHLQRSRNFHIAMDVRSRLEQLCRAENVSMFMLLVTAYQVLLHKIAAADDIAVMFNAANRQHPETQELIGMFTNPLILRSELSRDPAFRELLGQVRRTTIDAINHQELPWELLLRELRPDDELARFRWVNVYFGYHQRITAASLRGRDGIEIAILPSPTAQLESRFVLSLEVSEVAEGLHGEIGYDSSLFDDSTIAGWESQFLGLLDAILADPDQRLSDLSRWIDRESPPAEQQLAEIWREILNVERVRIRDNFFDLGGNSLLALRLVSRVRTVFHVELPLVALFAAPDLAGLANRILELQTTSPDLETPPIRRRQQSGPVPLSFAQEMFWTVYQLFPRSTVQTIHAAVTLVGFVNLDALKDSIREIVRRHEPLRTTFHTDANGVPQQVINPEFQMEFPVDDLTHLPRSEAEERAHLLSQEQAVAPFDLSRLPLFRIRLLKLDAQTHWLVVTTNHMIFDGWSLQVLILEVAQIYDAFSAGRPSPLPDLPVQYADYVLWQRERFQGPVLDRLRSYWHRKLAGLASPELPLDRPWQADALHIPNSREFHLTAEQKARIGRLCRSANVTPFLLLLTVFKILLHRYCGRDRIAVCVDVANRNSESLQPMLGLFVNVVVMHSDLSGNPTFRAALERVRQTAVEAYDHQEMPIELLAQELQPHREPRRFPLVQVLFNYHQRAIGERLEARSELALESRPTKLPPSVIRRELTLTMAETDRGLDGEWAYDSSLFQPETIERIELQFLGLLEQVLADPDRPLSEMMLISDDGHHARPIELGSRHQAVPRIGDSLIPLRVDAEGKPLFCIHGLGGHVAAFLPLARQFRPPRLVYGLQALGLEKEQEPQECIEDMAALYRMEIQAVQARGPYLLAGWSLGGLIAWEVAQQLTGVGEQVTLVALLDTYLSMADFDGQPFDDSAALRWLAPQLNVSPEELKKLPLDRQWERIAEQAQSAYGIEMPEIQRLAAVCRAQLAAAARYRPQPYPGPAVLFRTSSQRGFSDRRWRSLCPRLQVELVSGDHYSMLQQPQVAVLAERLEAYLQEHQGQED